ncbi:MAG: PaaX domain-containing protein, C- domain protein [Sciscionella sp.]|nr:PaaX domain-containing protein, C- domain protein [Sciscionella sp.]
MPTRTASRPLSARSVVLSLLLGAHPPELPTRELIRAADGFGIRSATLRVALSRMVTAGDLTRTATGYRLADRLLARQRRQDEAIDPRTIRWHGDWELAVITATGRSAAQRAELRADLGGLRLAELREGVWLRPANLRRRWPDRLETTSLRLRARSDHPESLAASLWELDGWAREANAVLRGFRDAREPARRLAAAAAIVRHLSTDPVLPKELLPDDWPADELRAAYADYRDELIAVART